MSYVLGDELALEHVGARVFGHVPSDFIQDGRHLSQIGEEGMVFVLGVLGFGEGFRELDELLLQAGRVLKVFHLLDKVRLDFTDACEELQDVGLVVIGLGVFGEGVENLAVR